MIFLHRTIKSRSIERRLKSNFVCSKSDRLCFGTAEHQSGTGARMHR